jgi:TatD DNase family protein
MAARYGVKKVYTDYKKMIAEGYYFTFGCEVKYSKKIQELLNLIPTTQLLTETDNPVGEEWLGGNTHEPDLIIRVMQDISDALNKELEEVEKMIFNNSRKILQKAGVLD